MSGKNPGGRRGRGRGRKTGGADGKTNPENERPGPGAQHGMRNLSSTDDSPKGAEAQAAAAKPAAAPMSGGSAEKSGRKCERTESGIGLDLQMAALSVVQPTSIIAAEKPSPGTRGEPVTMNTNMHRIKLPKKTVVYRYEMQIDAIRGGRVQDWCKNPHNDYYSNQKRKVCYALFIVLNKHPEHKHSFGQFYQMVYDRSRILYSLEKLLQFHPQKEFDVEATSDGFLANAQTFATLELDQKITSFRIVVRPAEEFEMVMDDVLPSINPDLMNRNRDLMQFLEVVTNQNLLINFNHVLFGNSSFLLDLLQGGRHVDGGVLTKGLRKSVRMIEGDDVDKREGKAAVPVLQLDLKASYFFETVLVTEYLQHFFNNDQFLRGGISEQQWYKIRNQLKEITVWTIHDPDRNHTFEIDDISRQGFDKLTMMKDGRSIFLTTYYATEYKTKIKYTHLPALMKRSGPNVSYFPMELCRICPNQRIPMEKETPFQQQQMIRETALKPADRERAVAELEQRSGIIDTGHLRGMGIEIERTTMQAPARQLPHPTVLYQKCELRPDLLRANWNNNNTRFDNPAACVKWTALVFGSEGDWPDEYANASIDLFRNTCTRSGMQMRGYVDFDRIRNFVSVEQAIELKMKTWSNEGLQFCLAIIPPPGPQTPNLKALMKFYECQYGVLTQAVLTTTFDKIFDNKGRGIIDKIIAKTNLKLGGRNYGLRMEKPELTAKYLDPKTMYLGMDVNHPPPMSKGDRARGKVPTEPSVVGMCANVGGDPLDLTGDYRYQDPRRELINPEVITDLMAQLLRQFARNRGYLPDRILLYRDGFDPLKIMKDEVPYIQLAFDQVYQEQGRSNRPKLTVFNVSKRTNVRLTHKETQRGGGFTTKNPLPGIVADTVIAHPVLFEFYHVPHTAPQGTATVTLYQVLLNESGLSSDDAQGITDMLCYDHQITTAPVSQTAVGFGAHELAKRGKENYRVFRDIEGSLTSDDSGASYATDGGPEVWNEANSRLTIGGSKLEDVKFNA